MSHGASFVCGTHRVFAYHRGGTSVFGELEPVESVRWNRKRDDISTAQAIIPTHMCCDLLAELRCGRHELHMVRDDETVWQGVITRIEYEFDQVNIFAEDLLWQAKRMVLTNGYNQAYPNIGNVIERMDWLLRNNCYALGGNPWNVNLQPKRHRGREPRTSRVVNAFQYYVWEDFDKYAEDSGTDYTVVNRDIFYWDSHLAWKIIPPLDESHISQFPRVVEYGNELATRAFVTNGEGFAGTASVPGGPYGIVDLLITNQQDELAEPEVPTPAEIAGWSETAAHNLDGRSPAPLSIVVPANTSLLPGAPWDMEHLIPGAWFEVSVSNLCRPLTQWQRLHEVAVEESAPNGETVSFTAVDAPREMILG